MARSPKAAAPAAPTPSNDAPSNDPRPATPERHPANRDELVGFYKQMLLIRRFEERAGQLYGLGLIGGFCHLYIGQEAVGGGNGPIILEMKTYRYRGHSMSDPAKYRSRDEVQAVREKSDPIEGAKRELLQLGVGEGELKAADDEIKRVVVEAASFAEESPEPEPAELYTDVLVESY